jgi:phosphopantothenoylcysteine decarboxylase/phosphopantothenate--cysteine ligase
MGYALATEARDRGAHVILISGPVALAAPYGIELLRVDTAMQMRDAVHRAMAGADVLVMSAAVADFRPAAPAAQKIKKESGEAYTPTDQGGFPLHLVRNPDILGELAEKLSEQGGEAQRRLIRVGFAAETHDLVANAQSKLLAKRLDLLVANDVSRADSGFGTDTNKVLIFGADGTVEDLPVMPKTGVAAAIWDRIVALLDKT